MVSFFVGVRVLSLNILRYLVLYFINFYILLFIKIIIYLFVDLWFVFLFFRVGMYLESFFLLYWVYMWVVMNLCFVKNIYDLS